MDVRCGNKIHAGVKAYHGSVDAVKACYANYPVTPSASTSREFVATFRNAEDAADFADNAARTLDATDITRKGKAVTFTLTMDRLDVTETVGDVRLTTGYYGATKIEMNGREMGRPIRSY